MEKNFPGVPNLGDITKIENPPAVDMLAGGFPCQDISNAASGWERPGLEGSRSGMWAHFARLIGEIKPQWVVIENVEALRYAGRGMGRVLSDLSALGYDAEWTVFRASDTGAPHRRARLWVVAYPHSDGEPDRPFNAETPVLSEFCSVVRGWPDPPRSLRVDDGFPDRVDRNRCLGNAIVPWAAFQIFQAVAARVMERPTEPLAVSAERASASARENGGGASTRPTPGSV